MEGITRVTARIEEIQAMVRTHTAPIGGFGFVALLRAYLVWRR